MLMVLGVLYAIQAGRRKRTYNGKKIAGRCFYQ